MKGPLFYAKILLFGEYGIIKDSKGLAIPYNSYNDVIEPFLGLRMMYFYAWLLEMVFEHLRVQKVAQTRGLNQNLCVLIPEIYAILDLQF